MVDIYEQRYSGLWKNTEDFIKIREQLMDEEEIKKVDFYLGKWLEERGSIAEELRDRERIEDLCQGKREENGMERDEAYVNVMTPNIEGQIAAMVNYNIAANLRGIGISDEMFKKTAAPIVDFILRHNDIKGLVKEAGRKYLKFGDVFSTTGWNADEYDGMGIPEIFVRTFGEILPDRKIRDPRRLNDADFIIDEVGQFSVFWAEREYGEEIAKAIQAGNSMEDFGDVYEADDNESFTLIRVWTKLNEGGNLQMILMSACGILLEMSDETAPYYDRVFNQYPVFFARLYQKEGEFYGYGDGKLLAPIQETINKIYDEIILACQFSSQGKTFVDPQAHINPDEFAENDPSKPIICESPTTTVFVSRGTGINEVIYNLLSQLFQQVQEVTRFSTLMTGQQGTSRTATESNILMQQGATGVDDKKGDLSKMLSDAVLYGLALCLENWSSAVALRVSDDKDDFIWVDPEPLRNVPKMVPATSQYVENWKTSQPKKKRKETPKWMVLEVDEEEDDLDQEPEEIAQEDGTTVLQYPKKTVKKPATGQIKLDLTLTIGEGMPTSKVAMYNILLSLSQLQVMDERTGQPAPLLTRKQVVDMVEDYLGIHIDTDEEGRITANGQPLTAQQNPPVQPPLNNSANVQGANINNSLAGVTA